MPLLEPVVLEGRSYTLRHIGPQNPTTDGLLPGIWENPSVRIPVFVLLNKSNMVARELPMVNNPNSTDMVSGQWTGRIQDAGDYNLTFPNKEASDGIPWRDRFDEQLKAQWIEILNDGYVEFAGCIEKIEKKRDQIIVSGHDGLFQTKSAYERDWTIVMAPRDVIERGTQLWVPVTQDDFAWHGTSTPNAQWTRSVGGTGSIAIGPNGGVILTVQVNTTTQLSRTVNLIAASSVWRSEVTTTTGSSATQDAFLTVTESDGSIYKLRVVNGTGIFLLNGTAYFTFHIAGNTSYAMMMESDGEWIWAFVNGQLIGAMRRVTASTTSLGTNIGTNYTGAGPNLSLTMSAYYMRCQQSFLMKGTDNGDYALPANSNSPVATYPIGGLHGRYYNDLDLAPDPQRLQKVLNPTRSQAYGGGSGVPEYQNQQDAQINGQSAAPGPSGQATPGQNWSVKWFGAIYLKMSTGTTVIQVNLPSTTGCAIRIWIGKTLWGDQVLDSWTFGVTPGVFAFNVTQAMLAGTLPYSNTKINRDGFYPMKVEYVVDSAVRVAPTIYLQSTPTIYVDPGGTSIDTTHGAIVIPATSLSPLGCIDQRYQGTSHFDIVQKTAQQMGYQIAVEPQSLESGLFPGICAPRFREGANYDVLLEPDDMQTQEGLLNYSNTQDATDIATTLQGNGAGFQNGQSGQLQANIFDEDHLTDALFDIQGWQDFSDASFLSLLQASLISQLGLRLDPWQVVSGDPVARVRRSYTWPVALPQGLAELRWRPGDGMRVYARDVGIQDQQPRQILVFTRNIHPNGSTGATVQFAARPRSREHSLREAMFGVSRWQRNYQRQLTTVNGNVATQVNSLGPGVTDPIGSTISLAHGDRISKAFLVVMSLTGAVDIFVNGANVTATLGGTVGVGWSVAPFTISINSVAAGTSGYQLEVQLKNNTAGTISVQYQLVVDLIR